MPEPARTETGTIYDIGYQTYDGPRLGRPYAVWSLFTHGIGAVFAYRRGLRAGLLTLVLAAAAVMPAVFQAFATAYTSGAIELLTYQNYFTNVAMVFAFFCAARAPELMSADQHTNTLVLYFARALHREDYVLAKVLALVASVLILTATPLLILFAGHVFMAESPWTGFMDEAHSLAPILGSSVVMALLMGTVSAAIASLTPRRTLAAAAVLGYFMLSGVIDEILDEAVSGSWEEWVQLLDPFTALGGFADWVFGASPAMSLYLTQNLSGPAFAAACAVYIVLGSVTVLARYRRIEA
jgi:ABC-2 type transport system permease protein